MDQSVALMSETEADADCLKLWKMTDSADEDAARKFGHDHVVEDMIAAVLDGRDPEVLPADALKAVEIVCAVYESARTGKTVYFN